MKAERAIRLLEHRIKELYSAIAVAGKTGETSLSRTLELTLKANEQYLKCWKLSVLYGCLPAAYLDPRRRPRGTFTDDSVEQQILEDARDNWGFEFANMLGEMDQ